MKASRLRGFCIQLNDKETQMKLPYLKQIDQLTLKFSSNIEQFMQNHNSIDSIGLQNLKRLRHLELILPEDTSTDVKLQLKDLAHLTAIFSNPEFKASVSIKAQELLSQDKIITVVPAYGGAANITSIKVGHIDERALHFCSEMQTLFLI